MKIYNLNDYSKVYVLGTLNGEFDRLRNIIRSESATKDDKIRFAECFAEQCNKKRPKLRKLNDRFNDSLLIVSGDCGLGFHSDKFYDEKLSMINLLLEEINSYLILIRGNHDNPEYFNDEKITFSRIKAVSDYSVLVSSNENILCVGGAISMDRNWRKAQEEYINRFTDNTKKIYWEGEAPIYDEIALSKIIEDGIDINYVVSHSAPSFARKEPKSGLNEWIENDTALARDIANERKVFDDIYSFLLDNNMSLKGWIYSHFDFYGRSQSNENIPFMSLRQELRFYSILDVSNDNETIEMIRHMKSKLGSNGHGLGGMFGNGGRPVRFAMPQPHYEPIRLNHDYLEDLDILEENEGDFENRDEENNENPHEEPQLESRHIDVEDTSVADAIAEDGHDRVRELHRLQGDNSHYEGVRSADYVSNGMANIHTVTMGEAVNTTRLVANG